MDHYELESKLQIHPDVLAQVLSRKQKFHSLSLDGKLDHVFLTSTMCTDNLLQAADLILKCAINLQKLEEEVEELKKRLPKKK